MFALLHLYAVFPRYARKTAYKKDRNYHAAAGE
jgi:hypothetical protein